jgi:hypothetical protein
VHRHGWRRRRPAVPRAAKKAARQRQRYLAQKALRPPPRRGLKARDPQGEAMAATLCERASALSQAALLRALARRDAEADARVLAILARALRDIAGIAALAEPERVRGSKAVKMKTASMAEARRETPQRNEASTRAQAGLPLSADMETPAAWPPVPPPPVVEEAPLSDADRRINAIAARFYARRTGDR